MPLRLRLGLLFALATGTLIAVVGGGFLLQLHISLDATLDAGLATRAAALAEQYNAGGTAAVRLGEDDDQPGQLISADGVVLASTPGLTDPLAGAALRQDAFDHGLAGADPPSFTTRVHGRRTRLLVTPVSVRSGPLLVVGADTEIADNADHNADRGLLVLGPLAVVVAGLGAWWLAGAALRPVERMRRQTAEISEHDDDTELAVPPTRDEIAALARTMNGLLGRLRAALAHERGFVADAGHELRTPLATLRAELELAARPGRNAAELREAVRGAGEETDRLIRLSEDLLLLARAQGEAEFLHTTTIDLAAVLGSAARAASATAESRSIAVDLDVPDHIRMRGDADRLRQALDNLLANAVRHSPDGGRVTLGADVGARTVRISVTDDGPGFPDAFLPHAFERFRRADDARARAEGGAGLGLSIVEAIVTAHHGRVAAANRPGGGAEVTVDLPVTSAGAARPGAVVDGASRAAITEGTRRNEVTAARSRPRR